MQEHYSHTEIKVKHECVECVYTQCVVSHVLDAGNLSGQGHIVVDAAICSGDRFLFARSRFMLHRCSIDIMCLSTFTYCMCVAMCYAQRSLSPYSCIRQRRVVSPKRFRMPCGRAIEARNAEQALFAP